MLTLGAPYAPRVVGLLPAVYLLAALSLDWSLRTAGRALGGSTARLLVRLVGLLLADLTLTSIRDYFSIYFASNPDPPPTAVATYVAALPEGAYVYDLPDGLFFGYGSTRYLAYRVGGEDLKNPPADVLTLLPKRGQIAFIVFPRWDSLLPVIERRFPGGYRRDVMNGRQFVFTGYLVRVPPSAAEYRYPSHRGPVHDCSLPVAIGHPSDEDGDLIAGVYRRPTGWRAHLSGLSSTRRQHHPADRRNCPPRRWCAVRPDARTAERVVSSGQAMSGAPAAMPFRFSRWPGSG